MSIVEKAIDKHRRAEPKRQSKFDAIRTELPAKIDTVAGPAHVSREVKLDHEKLAREGVTPFGKVADQLADEFRRLKRPLLASVFPRDAEETERHQNLVMVTSALSGEGKTFTSMNLAMSIALERDRTVLLVDADVAKPHVSRLLGIEQEPGLLDLIKDPSIDVADVLLQTDMNALKVIPAGQRDRFATELLASQRMEDIVEELASRYPDRIILFDSPPMLQTAEAQVLAALMGRVLLVVHASQTPQQAVMTVTELLGDVPVSVILNKSRVAMKTDYYGSYYGKE